MSDPIRTLRPPQHVDPELLQRIADDPTVLCELVYGGTGTFFGALSEVSGVPEHGIERTWRAGGFPYLAYLVIAAVTGNLNWYD